MLRAQLDGVGIDYEVHGHGPPVVFVHAGVLADWFAPLLAEASLRGGHQLVSYHRVGYAGSDHVDRAVTVAEQGEHCRGLMDRLGITRAHLIGHSSGAVIAAQVALRHPDRVATMALLEPAFPAVPRGAFAAEAARLYAAGDAASAVDTWLAGICGPDYADTVARVLPAAMAQARMDAKTFFEQELPSLGGWAFGPDEAARLGQPVLLVLGARSREVTPSFDQRHRLLLDWLPQVEPYVLPGATHLLPLQVPTILAGSLAAFFARHDLPAV